MYFWNVEKLKKQLAEAPLPSRDALRYLLGQGLLWSAASVVMIWPSIERNSWDVAGEIASAVVFVVGLLFAFHRNGGSAGRDFLGRVLSLGWVVAIRVWVSALLVFGVMIFVMSLPGPLPEEGAPGLHALVAVAVQLLYYARLAKHMGELPDSRPR